MGPTTSTERTNLESRVTPLQAQRGKIDLNSARVGLKVIYMKTDGLLVNGKELEFKDRIGETKSDTVNFFFFHFIYLSYPVRFPTTYVF